jgi:regulator of protease activity HflC (stomatin/prohibitin superfamily)
MPQISSIGVLIAIILAIYLLSAAIYILREYERGVVFRLGRLIPVRGPGFIVIIPLIDRLVRISLRIVALEVPVQDVITEDNVSVKVSAVIYYKPVDPNKAITKIEDFHYATSQIAQTTLRSVLGQSHLDELLSKRDELNTKLQHIIDEQTEPWGIKVTHVEVKNVDLPDEMQRAIARQAEAERERRAKIIHAKGEHQAAEELASAAGIIRTEPIALQLRFLQTLVEVATESKATVVAPIPIPIDIIKPFMEIFNKKDTEQKY